MPIYYVVLLEIIIDLPFGFFPRNKRDNVFLLENQWEDQKNYTNIPTILIIHLKRLLPGGKIHNHTPFDTTLDMEPFMTPGLRSAQRMELIGIISHQGTGKNGHYVAATKKVTEWILYDDATTTQLTPAQLHRLQAYVLIYRKTTPNTETGATPRADTSQQSTEKLEPVNQDH